MSARRTIAEGEKERERRTRTARAAGEDDLLHGRCACRCGERNQADNEHPLKQNARAGEEREGEERSLERSSNSSVTFARPQPDRAKSAHAHGDASDAQVYQFALYTLQVTPAPLTHCRSSTPPLLRAS